MPLILSTEKTLLTGPEAGDYEFFWGLWQDPMAMGSASLQPLRAEDIKPQLNRNLERQRYGRLVPWVIRDPKTDSPLGEAGFWRSATDPPGTYSYRCVLLPSAWNRGLEIEVGIALIHWGFNCWDISRIRCDCKTGSKMETYLTELGMVPKTHCSSQDIDCWLQFTLCKVLSNR